MAASTRGCCGSAWLQDGQPWLPPDVAMRGGCQKPEGEPIAELRIIAKKAQDATGITTVAPRLAGRLGQGKTGLLVRRPTRQSVPIRFRHG